MEFSVPKITLAKPGPLLNCVFLIIVAFQLSQCYVVLLRALCILCVLHVSRNLLFPCVLCLFLCSMCFVLLHVFLCSFYRLSPRALLLYAVFALFCSVHLGIICLLCSELYLKLLWSRRKRQIQLTGSPPTCTQNKQTSVEDLGCDYSIACLNNLTR